MKNSDFHDQNKKCLLGHTAKCISFGNRNVIKVEPNQMSQKIINHQGPLLIILSKILNGGCNEQVKAEFKGAQF